MRHDYTDLAVEERNVSEADAVDKIRARVGSADHMMVAVGIKDPYGPKWSQRQDYRERRMDFLKADLSENLHQERLRFEDGSGSQVINAKIQPVTAASISIVEAWLQEHPDVWEFAALTPVWFPEAGSISGWSAACITWRCHDRSPLAEPYREPYRGLGPQRARYSYGRDVVATSDVSTSGIDLIYYLVSEYRWLRNYVALDFPRDEYLYWGPAYNELGQSPTNHIVRMELREFDVPLTIYKFSGTPNLKADYETPY